VGLGTHCRCTIDVSTSSRDPGSPRPQILPSRFHQSHRAKRRDPGRQCLPGSHREILPGLPFGQPRDSRELRLTHHDFQHARRCTAWEIPRADFQRPAAPPRAKGCRLMIHRGAQFTPNLQRVNKFRQKTRSAGERFSAKILDRGSARKAAYLLLPVTSPGRCDLRHAYRGRSSVIGGRRGCAQAGCGAVWLCRCGYPARRIRAPCGRDAGRLSETLRGNPGSSQVPPLAATLRESRRAVRPAS
jgi:hypothetical protein